MSALNQRPYVLTIAGHDPSGGAGLNADIKTIEAFGVQGLSVCTAITYQTEDSFEDLVWLSAKKIRKQLMPLLERYRIDYVKIGIIEDIATLKWVLKTLRSYNPDIWILWDPVLKTSTGFRLQKKISLSSLRELLEQIDIFTPNWEEIAVLTDKRDPMEGAKSLSKYCAVYLKGGHKDEQKGVDYLWEMKEMTAFQPTVLSEYGKHGSGCVFSSALISSLSLGQTLNASCLQAKAYIEQYLLSSETLLGIHYQP
jgi:hydroxymethylpyrimidine/phosphomethylpyrimidine kinase